MTFDDYIKLTAPVTYTNTGLGLGFIGSSHPQTFYLINGVPITLAGGSIAMEPVDTQATALLQTPVSLIPGLGRNGFYAGGDGEGVLIVDAPITDVPSSTRPEPLYVGTGPITSGPIVFAYPNQTYAGGTVINTDKAVLTAPAALGTGPVTDADNSAMTLYIARDASANPNGMTTIYGGSFKGSGATFVETSGGTDRISVVNTSVIYHGGNGYLQFQNGSAPSTIYGGTGRSGAYEVFATLRGQATIDGGAGGGVFYGAQAGHNLIYAGSGAATIGGGGDGDRLFAGSNTGDLIAAGAGNVTLGAAGTHGRNTLFGGSGNTLITTGNIYDQVFIGTGQTTVFGGLGQADIFGGSGTGLVIAGGGPESITIGTGALTVFAGTGAETFGATKGAAGGTLTVYSYVSGVDHIALTGYMAAPVVTSTGGNTTVRLEDSPQITLVGVSGLGKSDLV